MPIRRRLVPTAPLTTLPTVITDIVLAYETGLIAPGSSG